MIKDVIFFLKHINFILFTTFRRHFQPHPQPSGHEAPEEDEEAVAPVDGDDGVVGTDALGNGEGNAVRVELERVVMSVGDEGGTHKARTDVVEVDVMDASDVAELGEAFHVVVDVAFGGGIGRGSTQSSCASDAADDGEVGFTVGMLHEVVEGGIDHLCEACHVSGNGCHLLLYVERWVLVTNSSTVKIEVHAARLSDEGEQTFRSIFLCDVDTLGGDHIEVFALNLLQSLLPTTSNAHLPTLSGEHLDHFESDARCGSDDDGSFLSILHCLHCFVVAKI